MDIKSLIDNLIEELETKIQKSSLNTQTSYCPLVSICIPLHNHAKYISEALDSALAQTYSNFEIIVVDDGSTDNSSEIINSYNDERIKYFYKEHTNAPDTRNFAISKAAGEWIFWLDSDDYLDSQAILFYINTAANFPDCSLFYSKVRSFDNKSKSTITIHEFPDWYLNSRKLLADVFEKGEHFWLGSTMIRKSVYSQIGNYNTDFNRAHDFEFCLRFIYSGNFQLKYIDEVLYHYRQHDSNISGINVANRDNSYTCKLFEQMIELTEPEELMPQLMLHPDKELALALFYAGCAQKFFHFGDKIRTLKYFEKSNSIKEIPDVAKAIASLKQQMAKDSSNFEHSFNYQPLISVCIPTFNRAHLITQTLDSILAQTYKNFEIIIVDDGSTDNTAQLINNYSNDSIKYIKNTKSGISKSRNLLINNAQGEYILWVDDDDLILETLLEDYVQALNKNRAIDVIYADLEAFDSNTGNIQMYFKANDYTNNSKYILRNIINGSGITFGGSLIRTSLLRKINGFDENYKTAEDNELWTRLALTARFFKLNKVVYRYRRHADNISNPYFADRSFESLTIRKILHQHSLNTIFGEYTNENSIKKNQAFYEIAKGLYNFGDYYNALKYFDKISKPNTEQIALKALCLINSGDIDSARSLIEQLKGNEIAVKLNNQINSILNLRKHLNLNVDSDTLIRQKSEFEKVFVDNDKLFDIAFVMGLICFKLERNEEAYLYFKKALLLNPNNDRLLSEIEKAAKILNKTDDYSATRERLLSELVLYSDEELVSVIIPTYNRPQLLRRALNSVFNQSWQNFEIIVINDAGSDPSDILSEYDNSKIKLVQHNTNLGASAAKNSGLKAATGKYIAYLDDDDEFLPQHIEALVNLLKSTNSKAGYSIAERWHYQNINDNTPLYKDIPFNKVFSLKSLLVANYVPMLALIHEKSCLDAIGYFDENYDTHEDWEFIIRLAAEFGLQKLSDSTCRFYTYNDSSSLSSKRLNMYHSLVQVYLKHNDALYNLNLYNERIDFINSFRSELLNHYTQNDIDTNAYLEFVNSKSDNINHNINVTIIIPIFNRLELTKQCIESIYNNPPSCDFDIIVIDNASNDGSYEYLEEQVSVRNNLNFIYNHTNLGFAKACNQGINAAESKYVLLLNNDIIAKPNWLDALINKLESDDNIGIAGSLLLYPDNETIQHAGVKLGMINNSFVPYHPNKLRKIKYVPNVKNYAEVNAVTGACMLIRKSYLDKIGNLDEGFINSYEDIDLCLRFRVNGYKVVYVPESSLIHYESMSPNRHDHDAENIRYFNSKWLGKFNPDIQEREFIPDVWSIWIKEELQKKPDDSSLREKLKQLIIQRGSVAEHEEYESYLDTISHDQKQTKALVSFIIPVRDNLEISKTCLESIFQTCRNIDHEIIVIDNASSQQTKEFLESLKLSHSNFELIRNEENLSYSKANNQGREVASGKYLIFLNNDIRLLPDSVQSIIDTFDKNESIGVQGSKLLYPNDTIQHAGIVWGKVKDDLILHYHIYLSMPKYIDCVNTAREYQFVTGAFLSIRADLFDKVSGFDENYYFGHEDLDLCLKARQSGYKVWYNPFSEAYHYESMTKKSEGIEKFERFISHPDSYDAQNHKYFLSKWENILIEDADNYFLQDGMHAFVSNPIVRNQFFERLEKVQQAMQRLVAQGRTEMLEHASKVLLGPAMLKHGGQINLAFIQEYRLKQAESLLVLSDVFDTGDYIDVLTDTVQIIKPKDKKKKLRILMTMYGWNESGGGTTFPKAFAKRLAAKGHEVAVFYATHNHESIKTPYFMEESVDSAVKLYGVYNRASVFLDPFNPEREIEDTNITNLFEKVLDEFKPDFVHFHNFLGLSFKIAEIAKSRNLVTLYTPYNYHLIDPMLYMYKSDLSLWTNTNFFENSELLEKNPDKIDLYKERIEKARQLINNNIDCTLAVSNRVKELLVDFGANAEKISVVHQVHESIETLLAGDYSREIHKPLRFGFIGGVMPHKGAHVIVQAAQLLAPGSAEFYIYGFISPQYADLLKTMDRKKAVHLMGEYHSKDLAEISKNLDAMILPSLWEDCAPFVITESLAMKLPVIASNIGGFPDFIKDKVNGRLFRYNSASELSAIISELTINPELVVEMQKNCTIPLTFEMHVDYLIELYNKIVDNGQIEPKDIKLLFN